MFIRHCTVFPLWSGSHEVMFHVGVDRYDLFIAFSLVLRSALYSRNFATPSLLSSTIIVVSILHDHWNCS